MPDDSLQYCTCVAATGAMTVHARAAAALPADTPAHHTRLHPVSVVSVLLHLAADLSVLVRNLHMVHKVQCGANVDVA